MDDKTPSGGATILLVDDNPAFREVTAEALLSLGYSVETSGSLDEALVSASRNGNARLLITDIVMGNINGVELASQVRLVRPGIKVLYCSGYPRTALARRGFDIGADDFLMKPVSVAALAPKMAELVGEPAAEANL
jgi:CheY-like chemotaxis protein